MFGQVFIIVDVSENLTDMTGLPEDGAEERRKNVGVLVKQCNLVLEVWCIESWFDEDR